MSEIKYENIPLGLKGCMKGRDIRYIKSWIKNLRDELRCAWDRAWLGYDYKDLYDLQPRLTERLITLLTQLNKNRHGLFNIPEKYKDMFDGRLYFTDEETDTIIQMIIYHLQMTDEYYVENLLNNGKCIYEMDQLTSTEKMNAYKRVGKVVETNKDLALDLLKDFWWDLWD